jgi:hypothetical protein
MEKGGNVLETPSALAGQGNKALAGRTATAQGLLKVTRAASHRSTKGSHVDMPTTPKRLLIT